MTKLPRNIKAKQLIIILKKLGFSESGKRGSHVRLSHTDGRWTQVAVHAKPIPAGTLRAVLRQTKLSIEQIQRYI